MNRLVEPVLIAMPKHLLTECSIHHRLESCDKHYVSFVADGVLFYPFFFTKSKRCKMWVSGRTWWYCCWYRHRCRNLLRSHFLRSDGPLRSGGAPIIPSCSYPHNFHHSCGAHQNCCGGGHCACCLLLLLHGSLRGVWWSESALRWMSRTG